MFQILKLLFKRIWQNIILPLKKKTNFAPTYTMEQLHPETHQYYFERYLREKLSAEEKAAFEQRLANDEELQHALETYKTNRKQFLKEIIQEHDAKPSKTSIINFVYLAITILGLVVILDFYFENKSLKEERIRNKNLITRLIDYIPFIGKKDNKSTEASNQKGTGKKDPKSGDNKTPDGSTDESTLVEGEPIDTPTLIIDSVWVAVPRNYLNDRLHYFQTEIDSTLTPVEILNMIYRNSSKGESLFKSRPVGIRIWETTQTNRYAYDGHLLNLYLNETPPQIPLINDEGELVWLSGDKEIILIADNELHFFTE